MNQCQCNQEEPKSLEQLQLLYEKHLQHTALNHIRQAEQQQPKIGRASCRERV